MYNVGIQSATDFQNSPNQEDIFPYRNAMGRLLGCDDS